MAAHRWRREHRPARDAHLSPWCEGSSTDEGGGVRGVAEDVAGGGLASAEQTAAHTGIVMARQFPDACLSL